MRRLWVLINGLPYESLMHSSMRAADAARKAAILPSRRAHYARKKAEQEALGDD